MHNKEYALKLVQDKINGLNNLFYFKIASITSYSKKRIYLLNKRLREKDIYFLF